MRWHSGQTVWPSSKSNHDWRPAEAQWRPPPPHPFREALDLTPPGRALPGKRTLVLVATLGIATALAYFVASGLPIAEPIAAEHKLAPPKSPAGPLVRLAGSGFVAEKAVAVLTSAWAGHHRLPGVRVDARSEDLTAGLRSLLRDEADFWMTSQPVEEADLDAVRQAGLPKVPPLAQFRRPGTEHRIASAAVVLVANLGNPVRMMTPAQTLKVFTGKITAWAQLGGQSNLPIGRYGMTAQHEETGWFCATFMGNANTATCLRSFGLLIKPLMDSPAVLAGEVADSPAAIGFAEFGDRGRARPMAFGTACGTAIEPTVFRIKAGDYPAIQPLYLYAAPGRMLPRAAKAFLDFALSAAGQAAIGASGLTDTIPMLAGADDRDSRLAQAGDTADASAFESAAAGAERVSVTFHFPLGATTPNGAADTDIARLAAWARQPVFAKSQWTLIGFTGRTEDAGLARQRADSMRTRVQAAGLRITAAVGVGPAAPIACDTDPLTAPLNRRVEVWMRNRR